MFDRDNGVPKSRDDAMLHVLFLIENVPFTLDSRVRRQSDALQDIGAAVFVICPRGKNEPYFYIVDGVYVYGYWKPSIGGGFAAHLLEYLVSLCCHAAIASYVVFRHRIDAIHVANPPDLLWIIAAPFRLLGKRFIYDQHDLVPELFEVRFKHRYRWVTRIIYALERMSYRLADHVIVTNETFRNRAIERGGRRPEGVTVVRNGPRLSRDFPVVEPDRQTRALGKFVVGYLGIMNPQDHLDVFLEMARIIYKEHQRSDVGFVMVGSGDSFAHLMRSRNEQGLCDVVRMTGTISWRQVLATLTAVDICVQPDPPTLFNKHLTMNKLMEYMALGKAVVAFDMPETRVSGGDCVVYVKGDSPASLAQAVLSLLDEPSRLQRLGVKARARVEKVLAWEHQSENLLKVYRKLFPGISDHTLN